MLHIEAYFKRTIFFTSTNRLDGSQKWISTRTKDSEKANELYRMLKPTLERPRIIRLEDLRTRILNYVRLNLKTSTLSLYKIAFDKFVTCIGNRLLRFITGSDVETFKEFLTKNVSEVSANDYVRTVNAGFNIGLRLNLITTNPFKGYKPFRIPFIRQAYLTKEEFINLLHSIEDRHFARLVLFAALTGIRRSEITTLRKCDIDFDARLIHIQNSEVFAVKAMRPRSIPMNQDVYSLLQSLNNTSEYVFVDADGKPYRPETVTRKFKHYARRFGLSEKIHLHSIRHSFALWLVQSATPLAEVQGLLGRASITTTEIYAHLGHEHLRAAAEKIRLYGFLLKKPTGHPPTLLPPAGS